MSAASLAERSKRLAAACRKRRRNRRPRPIGQVIGAVSSASVFSISSSRSNGSRVSRSILLMKVMIGMSRSRQTSNSLRVRASMPLAASITITAEIDRRQRAIGVFGEVLVAGRVQQVEDAIGIFERHHRSDDRNAALALDAHPVGAGLPPLGLGAHLAGKLDGAAEQQELFGQCRLAGVRMRNDRESAPARDGVGFCHWAIGWRKGDRFSAGRPGGEGRPRVDSGQHYARAYTRVMLAHLTTMLSAPNLSPRPESRFDLLQERSTPLRLGVVHVVVREIVARRARRAEGAKDALDDVTRRIAPDTSKAGARRHRCRPRRAA